MGEKTTSKVVILLLVLAIVFSAVSIFIGISALNLEPQRQGSESGGSSSGASLEFVVEASKAESGGGGN